MIDFIPIIIFSKFEMFLRQYLCFQDAISVISILLAVYMLLKDFLFDGRSIGKRFVNIRIVRPDNYDKDCLILRNLPLSLMVLLLVWQDMTQYIHLPLMRLGFVLYMWADFICFAQKGKTIGDCLAHTSLEVSEDPNYLLQKDVSKRIACFVVVLILLEYEGGFVSPHMFVSVFTDQFIPSLNLTFAQCFLLNHSIYILFQCVAYVYVLCKLVEYKHLRGMVMVLFGVYLCCDIYTWSTQDLNISWVFILLYIVIVAVLLYMTTNRRLGDSQIRTDLENKLSYGTDVIFKRGKTMLPLLSWCR